MSERPPFSDAASRRVAGSVKQITSFSNPLVKDIKALVAQRKHRQRSGRFVAEGLKLATDALAAGWGIDMLVLGPEARESETAREVAATARARGATILEVSTPVLAAMTRRDNPQMVVGVYVQAAAFCADCGVDRANLLAGAAMTIRVDTLRVNNVKYRKRHYPLQGPYLQFSETCIKVSKNPPKRRLTLHFYSP